MTTFSATLIGTFVSLVVSDVTADSVLTITRDPSPGSIVVRGTPKELAAGGATVLSDVEYPYGTDITYTAVLRDPTSGAELETLTDTVSAIALGRTGMVVSDPFTDRQVVLTVVDQRDESSEFRGSRFELAGRTLPTYVLEKHGGWRWTNEWVTAGESDRVLLDDLLRQAGSVLLRVSQGCDLRDGWVVAEEITVRRGSVPATDTSRRWEVAVAETAAPGSDVETVTVTLQDLHEWEPGTLQDLADRTPVTLLELALAVTADA